MNEGQLSHDAVQNRTVGSVQHRCQELVRSTFQIHCYEACYVIGSYNLWLSCEMRISSRCLNLGMSEELANHRKTVSIANSYTGKGMA